jgi:hypothetical protein
VAETEKDWLARDSEMLKRLVGEGWSPTEHSEAFQLTDVEFCNGEMSIHLYHEPMKDELDVSLEAGGARIDLKVRFGNDVDSLLDIVNSWKTKLNAQNFPDFVENIIVHFPEVFEMTEDSKKRIYSRHKK